MICSHGNVFEKLCKNSEEQCTLQIGETFATFQIILEKTAEQHTACVACHCALLRRNDASQKAQIFEIEARRAREKPQIESRQHMLGTE